MIGLMRVLTILLKESRYYIMDWKLQVILNNKAKNIDSFTTHNQSKEPRSLNLVQNSVCIFREILKEASHYI